MNIPSPQNGASLETLRVRWLEAWPRALEAWSRYVQLRPPKLCLTTAEAVAEGLDGSFAMIRLQDQSIVVDLPRVRAAGVENLPVEVLAHEIGHHVLAPATLTDHARILARMRAALPTIEQQAPFVANLYTDLLINDRLQRSAGLHMDEVYRRLAPGSDTGKTWQVYLRIYELLWSLAPGALGSKGRLADGAQGDAWLGMRIVRHFAGDRVSGAGRFAALMLPYLLEDASNGKLPMIWHDTRHAGKGGQPAGLTETEADEHAGAIHPANDPVLCGIDDQPSESDSNASAPSEVGQHEPAGGQARQPYEYGEILRAAGISLSDHEMAVRYYRERASPHLIRFPSRRAPRRTDALPEGLEPWEVGDSLDAVDWLQTVLLSPKVIPGLTTVQRVWGQSEGDNPRTVPLDLDLYVDSSGSMPDPKHFVSYLTLAGAILGLSALRAGARVKATLWSGKNQVTKTDGFVREVQSVMEVLTGYYGGATQFPIHELRATYRWRPAAARPAHILVISDDGVSTMFDRDEQGNEGWQIARESLDRAGGGGTLLLNLPANWEQTAPQHAPLRAVIRAREEQNWNVCSVTNWEALVTFARAFGRREYGGKDGDNRTVAA